MAGYNSGYGGRSGYDAERRDYDPYPPAGGRGYDSKPPYYDDPRWDWCNMIWSVISLFCCPVLGFLAIMYALLSYIDHKAGDFRRATYKKRISWALAVTSIVTVLLFLIILFILATTESTKNDEFKKFRKAWIEFRYSDLIWWSKQYGLINFRGNSLPI